MSLHNRSAIPYDLPTVSSLRGSGRRRGQMFANLGHGDRLRTLLIIGIATLACAGAGFCEPYGGDAVRIGLTAPPFTAPESVTVTCTSDYVVIDLCASELISQREAGSVWVATTRPIAGSAKPQSFRIRIKPLDADGFVRFVAPAARWDRYRGAVEIETRPGGTLHLVNDVPVEDYLRGVVPAEMPSRFELEALKAQAIAARTYALRGLARHAGEGFDLCNCVCCQVYGGAAIETERTDRAVADTTGKILTYQGRPIVAMYHSDCGGMTQSAANVGFAEGEPYLRSIADAPDDAGPEYCVNGHAHRWTIALSGDALARVLARMKRSASTIDDVTIGSRDDTGRAKELIFHTSHGTVSVPATGFRMACGSTRIKSTNFTVTKSGARFVFEGIGYGHGLGMCQYGANGRASAPYAETCEQILQHYYCGTQIESWAYGTGSLSGTVRRSETDAPIPGTRIVLVGCGREARTDADGRFRLNGLSAGAYDLRFESDGCLPLCRWNVRVPSGGEIDESAVLRASG
jgi:stage II sporulation protein D